MGFSPLALSALEVALAPARRALLHGPLLEPVIPVETGVPIVLVSNHVSWWDGFLLRTVQKKLRPGARLFTVMLENELRRKPFLRRMGCVGIEPGSRTSVLRVFRRLQAERRQDADAVIAFFPQGRIWPSSRRPLGFERGVSLLCSMLAPVIVLPVAIHVEPLNRAAPTAFVALGAARTWTSGESDHETLEAAVERELDRLRVHLERHGEDAPNSWTSRANSEGSMEGAHA